MRSPGCDGNRWSSQTAFARVPADCLPASAAAPACDSLPSPAYGSAQTILAGIRNAGDAPLRSSGLPPAPSSLLRPDIAGQSCGSILPGLPPPPGTSSPHSDPQMPCLLPTRCCLAHALLLGFGRRLRPASAFALPPSLLDLVQGTAQKIHHQYLLGQSLLQLLHLLRQRLFPPPVRSQHLRIQTLLPPRQSPAIHSQLQCHFR